MMETPNNNVSGDIFSPLLEEEVVESGDVHVLLSEEEEQQVPAFTQFFVDAKRWLRAFQYPLKIFFGNFISMLLIAGLLSGEGNNGSYPTENGSVENNQFKTMLIAGLTIALLTFLADAYLCLEGARKVERDVQSVMDQDQEGSHAPVAATATAQDTGVEADEVDFVQMSRRVDALFGSSSGGSANSTFLVCLLYALFAVAVWQSAKSGSSLLQVLLLGSADINEKGQCFVGGPFYDPYDRYEEKDGIVLLKQSPDFNTLPRDVQQWIGQSSNKLRRADSTPPIFNRTVAYLQPGDGTLVFAKFGGDGDRWGHNPKNLEPGFVVFSPSTNSFKEYSETKDEGRSGSYFSLDSLELIAFPAQPPFSGWCGIFSGYGYNLLHDEVLCSNTNTGKFQRFPAVRDDGGRWNGWSSGDKNKFATDDTLWIADARNFHTRRIGRTVKISLVSYNIATMEKRLELSRNVTKKSDGYGRRGSNNNPNCVNYQRTTLGVSLVALCLVSAYLYRLDVPSNTVPVVLALWVVLGALVEPAGAGITLLVMACYCLHVLVWARRTNVVWKYSSKEMLVWALYTCQFTSNWGFWSQSFTSDDVFLYDIVEEHNIFKALLLLLLAFGLGIATTVLLNHPVFQALSFCFGSLGIFGALCTLWRSSRSNPFPLCFQSCWWSRR